MSKKPTKKKPYTVTVTLGDKAYSGSGDSVFEALTAIERPNKIMLKGIVTVTSPTGHFKQMYFPTRLKRLFYSPTMQRVHAKMLERHMKPL